MVVMWSNITIIHGTLILTFVRNKSHELQLMISCHIANRNYWNQAEWWMLKPFDMNDGCFLAFSFWCSECINQFLRNTLHWNVFDWINIGLSNSQIWMSTIFITMINIWIAYIVWFYCYLSLYIYVYDYCQIEQIQK